MSLRLEGISKTADGETYIHPVDLELQRGSMNVLLGPTRAGKTSLLRLMSGLDKPDTGKIDWDGQDVTDMRVQQRDVAMVYQQFVNYPSMSVYENIASPLRLQKRPSSEIDAKVREMAELLQLSPLLDRKPHQISGGQQQRCAIARALVKDVGLVLMDEPLANLDYKLREELRVEIPRLFEASGSIFVYATTEPDEALLLGGNTATLWEGRVTQFGPSTQVYRQPCNEITARVFSDPPLNLAAISKCGSIITFHNGQSLELAGAAAQMPDGDYKIGFRSHQLKIADDEKDAIDFDAQVIVTELTGSHTFVHLDVVGARWIALVPGPRDFEAGQPLRVSVRQSDLMFFDERGNRAVTPKQAQEA